MTISCDTFFSAPRQLHEFAEEISVPPSLKRTAKTPQKMVVGKLVPFWGQPAYFQGELLVLGGGSIFRMLGFPACFFHDTQPTKTVESLKLVMENLRTQKSLLKNPHVKNLLCTSHMKKFCYRYPQRIHGTSGIFT